MKRLSFSAIITLQTKQKSLSHQMKAAGPLLAVALAKLNLPQQPQPAMACSQVWERSGLHFQPFLPVVFWSFFFLFVTQLQVLHSHTVKEIYET